MGLNDAQIQKVKRARDIALQMMVDAACKLQSDPADEDSYAQVQYCLHSYATAQRMIDPQFYTGAPSRD